MLAPRDDFRGSLWRHHASLKSYAVSLCRDRVRADDLVQAAFLRALENEDKFMIGTNLAAWLFTIMRNLFLSERRGAARMQEDPNDTLARAVPFIDDPSRRLEAREMLQLIDMLPSTFKAPLRLAADGATMEEIAGELGEHIGTIKSRTHRARAMLGKER